jgi:hypothetical protein
VGACRKSLRSVWNQARTAREKLNLAGDFMPEILADESWDAKANNITATCLDEKDVAMLYKYQVN